MRGFLSGVSLLIAGVLIGVLVGPQLHPTGYRRGEVDTVSQVASVSSASSPSAAQSQAAAALRAVLIGPTTLARTGASPSTRDPYPSIPPPSTELALSPSSRPVVTAPSSTPGPDDGTSLELPELIEGTPVVVGLGDSITYDPGSWFRRLCRAEVVLRNCVDSGVRGNTTAQMLDRIDSDVFAHQPSVVIVMGGTNDIRAKASTKRIMRRLDQILDRVSATGALPILATVPPRDRLGDRVLVLNAAIRDYARRGNVPLLDLYAATGRADGRYRFGLSRDGTHPSRKGAEQMAALAGEQLPALIGGRLLAGGVPADLVGPGGPGPGGSDGSGDARGPVGSGPPAGTGGPPGPGDPGAPGGTAGPAGSGGPVGSGDPAPGQAQHRYLAPGAR